MSDLLGFQTIQSHQRIQNSRTPDIQRTDDLCAQSSTSEQFLLDTNAG